MSSFDSFRLLSQLFDVLERVATPGRVKSLTFKNAAGHVVGGLTLEGAFVRVGVQVEGRPYIDDVFRRELPGYVPLLSKLLRGESLTEAEMQRLQNVPLLARRTLRAVTARALRRLALCSDLSQLSSSRIDGSRDKPAGALSYMFPLIELMLAAGSSGSIRYTDIAARLYETPSALVEERWIFEWQADDPGCPWPVMTTGLADRQISTVASFGQLGQQLAHHLQLIQCRHERRLPSAQVAITDQHAYYAVSTERYFTLLVYQAAHVDRLLHAMQDLLASSAEPSRLPPAAPSPATPVRAPSPMQSPATPVPAPGPVETTSPGAPSSAPRKEVPAEASTPRPAPVSSTETEAMQWIEAAAELPIETAAAPPPPAPPPPLLMLRSFTAIIQERTILKGVNLEIGRRGVYALMGPGGSGKSALLGILSGRNRGASGWTLNGTILYDGKPLGTALRPAVVEQALSRRHVRLFSFLLPDLDDADAHCYPTERLTEILARVQLSRLAEHLDAMVGIPPFTLTSSEWRRLAIARELLADPALLCLDEPTAGLDDAEAAPIVTLMRGEGQRRAVLFVTHNQQQARECSDQVILFASGRVQESQPTGSFFTHPTTRAAKDYVRTGGCAIPSPDARAEHLEVEFHDKSRATPHPQAEPLLEPAKVEPATPPAETSESPAVPAPIPDHVIWSAPSRQRAVLVLRDFGLKVGGRTVLSQINLDVAERGLHLLVAADGANKRFLLRALCGPRPDTFEMTGQAHYLGRALVDGEGPSTRPADARLTMMPAREYLTSNLPARSSRSPAELLAQAQQLVEQAGYPELVARFDVALCDLEPEERRALEILRAAAASPALLVLDEPLAGLSASAQQRLLRLLREQAGQRSLLLFLLEPAVVSEGEREPPPPIAWLYADHILDSAPRREQKIEPAAAPPAALPVAPHASGGSGPRGFLWLRRQALAGMPAPGLTSDLRYDLELLRAAGITHLVTLTEQALPAQELRELGLSSLHFPIADMDAPELAATAAMCQRVEGLIGRGHRVVYHCKAGLGRTGTMLAAQLIYEGATAQAALAQVRAVEPRWVQSDKQVRFLTELERWLAEHEPISDHETNETNRPGGTPPRRILDTNQSGSR